MSKRQQLIAIYTDYVNNYITVCHMAKHYGVSVDNMRQLVSLGQQHSDTKVRWVK